MARRAPRPTRPRPSRSPRNRPRPGSRSPPPAALGSADERAAFARGATLQRDGDYDGAAAVYTDLARNGADDVATEARLRLGQSLIGARRPADALEPLQAVASARPGGPATFLLGRALAELGRCQDAMDQFAAFGSANPGPLRAQAEVAQASCLADLGRPSEGVALAEQAATTPGVS